MTQQVNIPLWQRYLLRLGILLIVLISLPLQPDFYSRLFSLSWHYFLADIFHLATFLPHYFGPQHSLYDWVLVLVVSLLGAAYWLQRTKNSSFEKEQRLYYYLRIFVRFKLAAILFVAGFSKLFPVFVPELSLSHLNTAYGYFTDEKQFLLSLAAAPAYVVFLGIVELLTAFLLLFRKTSFLAVIFVVPFYGNAFLGDLAYNGSSYLTFVYIVLLTLPIFLYDIQRLGALIVDFKQARPASWKLDWSQVSWKTIRQPAKALFVFVFVILVGFKSYSVYKNPTQSLHYPQQAGLPDIAGKYLVDSFVLNGDTLAHSPSDSLRWKDVVFEKWNTLSIRKAQGAIQDVASAGLFQRDDAQRDYEYSDVGDRLYYRYQIQQDSLVLKNPNPNYAQDQYNFRIERPDSLHVCLTGRAASGQQLDVRLRKADKKYLLYEVKKAGRSNRGFKL